MNRLKVIALTISDHGGVQSPSFKSFARKFKNDITKELTKKGCKLTAFSRGHYYVSGFFRNADDLCFYFSISDVRHFGFGKMLYRSARDEKDYTGGRNRYVDIRTGMVQSMDI